MPTDHPHFLFRRAKMVAVPAALAVTLLAAGVLSATQGQTTLTLGLLVVGAVLAGLAIDAARRGAGSGPALTLDGPYLAGGTVTCRRPAADYRYVIATDGTGWTAQIACPDDRTATLVRLSHHEVALSTGEPITPQTVSAALEALGVRPGLRPIAARPWEPQDGR